MDTLKQNILNIFGEKGKRWIDSLPEICEELAHHWHLKNVISVDNMTFNYVAKANTNKNQPIVLKICCDERAFENEVEALTYFNGIGSVQLIASYSDYNALLLQQAIPGITLKSLYPAQLENVMTYYIDTMMKLHHKPLPRQHHFRHIKDWLTAIDQLTDKDCPSHLRKKAVALKNTLLSSISKEYFLHGDLHHDNILQDGNNWLAIDPKGVVGEREFEIAAFDFMYIKELANKNEIKKLFNTRVNLLAQKADLDAQRIKDWVFVRLILMIAWHVEDKGDPSWAIQLADALF